MKGVQHSYMVQSNLATVNSQSKGPDSFFRTIESLNYGVVDIIKLDHACVMYSHFITIEQSL